VVGLGSSAAQVSHHSAAQVLNGSRLRPRQVPRRISGRFSAARSRASSGAFGAALFGELLEDLDQDDRGVEVDEPQEEVTDDDPAALH
jgi:hypothetical protein